MTSTTDNTSSQDDSSGSKAGSHEPSVQAKAPRSLREKIPLGPFARTLPIYAGPYSVGVMEVEVPVECPRSFACGLEAYKDYLQLETVLMCIYYPSAIGSGVGDDGSGQKGWSRLTWLPRPRRKTADGYGKFAGIPSSIAELWFAATTMPTKLPAFRNAPPAQHWAPDITAREGGFRVKNEKGKPPPGFSEDSEPTFPLMIFSHGLGGTRTAYSHVCGEFASFGFVVCAVEHRDGSAPRTYVLREPQDEEDIGKANPEGELRGDSSRYVDYIFPKDNPFDTSPSNDKGVDHDLRNAQLTMRKAEIKEAYEVMCKIRDGEGEVIARQNLRRKGHTGSSTRGLTGVDWSKWKDRFHLQQVTMVGHSFGAATTVEILREREKDFPFITQGIIYDIWGAPVRPPGTTDTRISCPLLGINSEAFMYWEDNFNKAMSFIKESATRDTRGAQTTSSQDDTQGHSSYLLTVKGTVHISQSDFPLLYPHVVSATLHTTVPPHRAIEVNIRASLEFLKKVLPERMAAVEHASKTAGLLDVAMIDSLPMHGKPKHQKHLAFRIRRPSRLVSCFKGDFKSIRIQGWEKRHKSKLDISSDDIWMHFAPGKSEDKIEEDDATMGSGTSKLKRHSTKRRSGGHLKYGPKGVAVDVESAGD